MYWLIKTILTSLTLIAVSHYLYIYFKNNLTQPKLKDLVNEPKEHYEKIFKTINEKPILETGSVEDVTQGDDSSSYEAFNQGENLNSSNMASELNNFLDESLSGPFEDSAPSSFNDATLQYNNFSFNI